VDLKIRSLNAFATKVKKTGMKIRDRYETVNITLCNKDANKFHKMECINRECGYCQTDLVMMHLGLYSPCSMPDGSSFSLAAN